MYRDADHGLSPVPSYVQFLFRDHQVGTGLITLLRSCDLLQGDPHTTARRQMEGGRGVMPGGPEGVGYDFLFCALHTFDVLADQTVCPRLQVPEKRLAGFLFPREIIGQDVHITGTRPPHQCCKIFSHIFPADGIVREETIVDGTAQVHGLEGRNAPHLSFVKVSDLDPVGVISFRHKQLPVGCRSTYDLFAALHKGGSIAVDQEAEIIRSSFYQDAVIAMISRKVPPQLQHLGEMSGVP